MRTLACVLLIIGACARDVDAAPVLAPEVAPRLFAVLLNGGGSKPQNFRSHLMHVDQLFTQLERAGVDRSRITILSGDGEDPEPDVALRDDLVPEDFWIVDGTRLAGPLRPPIDYVDTRVGDVHVRPATREAVFEWFAAEGSLLRPGDTLLFYVTDHGSKNPDDNANNSIVLWGDDGHLSVQELSALVSGLDPGVRVVTVMSQCYSGAFAGLGLANAGSDRPAGNVCGYFSSTADRQAYGCYPENRGRENVGHSFHFLETFAATGRLAAAHNEVLVADATPDVPLRSSDVYLGQLLERAAHAANRPLAEFVDVLLVDAWRDRKAWEEDLRRLDRIGAAFGIFSPRSLRELDAESERIDGMVDQLKTHGRAWRNALESLARANLDRFLERHPEWGESLDAGTLASKARSDIDAMSARLLPAMAHALDDDPATAERFRVLRDNTSRAKAIGYRMEVRQGVVLRMRALILSIAGRVYLAETGSPTERATYEGQRACENLEIPPLTLPPGTELARADPFPVLADDVALADSVLPTWLGIQFRQAREGIRTTHALAPGAVSVLMVYDDSPASRAGVQEGDVVLGPPGARFVEKDQIREWAMRSQAEAPTSLEILRDGGTRVVTLIPKAMPQKWPSLPGPPKVGSLAPALRLVSYRGVVPASLADGRPRLLFFWATWCGICKAAVPELLAFEAARGTEVVAITDETAVELDPFFQSWVKPFPSIVASDENRATFRNYGVSGTPSFVLVDGAGIVQAHTTGYTTKKGLQIDGWTWEPPPAAAGTPTP